MLVNRSVLALTASIAVSLFALAPLASAEGPAVVARPDTAGLRYYAVRGEQARVDAELARLKSLYPSWTPPTNLFEDGSEQERVLWTLYADGSVDQIGATLQRLQQDDPSFRPSEEFERKYAGLKARSEVAAAWKAGAWSEMIERVDAQPSLLAHGDVELIWYLADAYAALDRPEDAESALRAAIASSATPQDRAATLGKAAQMLPLVTVKALASGDIVSDAPTAAAIVRGALVRNARLGLDLPDELKPALAIYELALEAKPERVAVRLLAWWRFGISNYVAANRWFAHAMKLSPDAKLAEGAIMSAMRAGDGPRAAALLGAWQDKSPELEALYISAYAPHLLTKRANPLGASFLSVFAARTGRLQSGEGAEALAWFAHENRQGTAAAAWFDRALAWRPTETAAYGRALTAVVAQDRAAFDRVRQAHPNYASVASLKFGAPTGTSGTSPPEAGLRVRIVREYKAGRHAKCLALSAELGSPLRAGDNEMRGWCLLGSGRFAEAERAFARAVAAGGEHRVPAAYGQSLAALRAGKTNDALSIANAHPLTPAQRRTVDTELLTQRARAAFDNRDYAASVRALDARTKLTGETRDLSVMRGWSHYHVGDHAGAQRVFARLDSQLSTRETRRGIAAATIERKSEIQNDR